MKSLTINFDVPKLEVNGHVFELKQSDADIYKRALALADKYRNAPMDNPESVLDALETICGYVDEILGKGAMKKISGGKPVSVNKAIECMVLIAKTAVESYTDAIDANYGE